jgi:DNA-binding CsgD family transcriptional regulator
MRGSKTKRRLDGKVEESVGEWQGLVRKLVLRLGRVGDSPVHENREEEQVLFDGEVDGVRCLLLRSRTAVVPPVILSPREREIVRMIAKGLPNKTIADVLEISGWTVCSHLRRIFSKLGVNSRAAMVARVLEMPQLAKKHMVRPGLETHATPEIGSERVRPLAVVSEAIRE